MATDPRTPEPPVAAGRRLDEALRAIVRSDTPRGTAITTLLTLAGTIAIIVVVFAALGANPGTGLKSIIKGSLGNEFNFGQTVMIATMLMLTGLAAAIPFSARLWNIGGEGQLYMGAFAAVAVALVMPADTPSVLMVILCLAAGLAGGGAAGLVPGALKATINANEMIVSLMMNFVCILAATYAITKVWPEGVSSATRDVPPSAILPDIWGGTLVTLGAPIAVVAVGAAWFVMARMKLGFEIRAIGLNAQAARMSGVALTRGAVMAFLLGGAFAGLAGAINVIGVNGALISQFSRNFGYLGIAVALVARLDPRWIIPSAVFFSILRVGTNSLPATTGLDPGIGEMLVATFVVLLLATRVIRLRYAEAAV